MRKIAIIGSRKYQALDLVTQLVNSLADEITDLVLISGGALGVDQAADRAARARNMNRVIIYPDYVRFKKFAPLKRNEEIVDLADAVIAFHNGDSTGTRYALRYAEKVHKLALVLGGDPTPDDLRGASLFARALDNRVQPPATEPGFYWIVPYGSEEARKTEVIEVDGELMYYKRIGRDPFGAKISPITEILGTWIGKDSSVTKEKGYLPIPFSELPYPKAEGLPNDYPMN